MCCVFVREARRFGVLICGHTWHCTGVGIYHYSLYYINDIVSEYRYMPFLGTFDFLYKAFPDELLRVSGTLKMKINSGFKRCSSVCELSIPFDWVASKRASFFIKRTFSAIRSKSTHASSKQRDSSTALESKTQHQTSFHHQLITFSYSIRLSRSNLLSTHDVSTAVSAGLPYSMESIRSILSERD